MSKQQLGFAENFGLSGAAAVISKTAAAQIERVKMLVQNQDELLKVGRLYEPYKGVIDCTVRTYRTEWLFTILERKLYQLFEIFPNTGSQFCFQR